MSVKSANRSVMSSGRQAASSRGLLWLARAGFVARGVTYVLIGVLAVQIGLGSGGKEADRSGALHAIAAEPGGAAVLWLLAVGFAGMALWRLAEAAYGQAGPGGRTAGKRGVSLGRGVELPRVFRTGNSAVIYAAACISSSSSMTSCGVL